MNKILIAAVAALFAINAGAVSLDTYTGISNAAVIVQTAVANGAVITSAVFNAKQLKGYGTLCTAVVNGTNTAGGGTITLQDSADGSTAWSNVTAITFASTNSAGATFTKVDYGANRAYYRVLATATADANRVTATLNGYK